MKTLIYIITICFTLSNCTNKISDKSPSKASNALVGTWKMVYAEIKENDSIQVKDLTSSSFIKIINESHFSFFNQEYNSTDNFYGGAGTYTLNGNDYVETLSYTSVAAVKNHQFPFTVQFKGDTLIQTGLEEVKAAGINREITEKYIKINKQQM